MRLDDVPSDSDTTVNGASRSDAWTVQKVLVWSANWLKEKGMEREAIGANPRLEAELLLASVLKCDRMRLYLDLDRPLQKDEREAFKVLLMRRVEGEPVNYILGYRDFYRHRFIVNKDVLVPRPDTEILVEKSLDALTGFTNAKILDIGTGSGCIGISLAKECADSEVLAWDVSNAALLVARQNADMLDCRNIVFELRDVFSETSAGPFDLIVSNPPYITRAEEDSLSVGVRKYEPGLALFDDRASDGLSFYRLIAEKCRTWLKPGGHVAVECGHRQGASVVEIFGKLGLLELTITKDLSGHDRVVSGKL